MKPTLLILIRFEPSAPLTVAVQFSPKGLSQPEFSPERGSVTRSNVASHERRQSLEKQRSLARCYGSQSRAPGAVCQHAGEVCVPPLVRGARRGGCLVLLLAILCLGPVAQAQSNKPPGPQDYPAFSRFITDRNIFDPSRQPHYSSTVRPSTFHPKVRSAPDLQLVGTMNYEKGRFAFFNGNSSEFKQALPVGAKIAEHTIVSITATEVLLESADHKDQLRLKVGEGLRQENGKWVLSTGGSEPASTTDATPPSSSGSSEKSSPAPSSAGEPNDVLKRLMQLREKENQ